MSHEFRLPMLGADLDVGTLVEWHVQPGGQVHRGDIVAVVETEKGAIDIEIFEDAVFEKLLVQPGAKITVGTVLAKLRGSPAKPGAISGAPGAAPPPPASAPATPAAPGSRSRIRISPVARRFAAQAGLDLATVKGTGPDGAISLEDVEHAIVAAAAGQPAAAAATPATAAAVAPAAAVPAAAESAAPRERLPAQPAREVIAAAMSRAKREIPHYYLWLTMDCSAAADWLAACNARVPVTERMLFPALVLRAVAIAATERPGFNGYYRDGRYDALEDVHLGVAIARHGGGLVAPALLDAGAKALPQLMQEFRDLVSRARAGRLRSRELAAATLTVTSLGDIGVDGVLPIIYPPQVAIVGVGQLAQRPWVVDGRVVPRSTLTIALGADHRVSDGRAGAQFLADIQAALQAPEQL
jgi:pyruvate dehydrogenase E2 component (dihydrolipoamide acetyltransferase)